MQTNYINYYTYKIINIASNLSIQRLHFITKLTDPPGIVRSRYYNLKQISKLHDFIYYDIFSNELSFRARIAFSCIECLKKNLLSRAPLPSAALCVFPTNMFPILWLGSTLSKAAYTRSDPHVPQFKIKLTEPNPIEPHPPHRARGTNAPRNGRR